MRRRSGRAAGLVMVVGLALAGLGLGGCAGGGAEKPPVVEQQSYADELILRVWREVRLPPAHAAARGHAIVAFAVRPDGATSGLTLEQSSGSPAVDAAALAAVTRAGPFPPLPPEQPREADGTALFRVPVQFMAQLSPKEQAYLADMRLRLGRVVQYPIEHKDKGGRAFIAATLHPDGTVDEASVAVSSGLEGVDSAALTAMRRASPFAPVPAGFPRLADGRYRLLMPIGFNPDTPQAAYIRDVQSRIQRLALGTVHVATRPTVVSYFVRRDGTIDNAVIQHSAGEQRLDTVVLNLVRQASPLPALPPGVGDAQGLPIVQQVWFRRR